MQPGIKIYPFRVYQKRHRPGSHCSSFLGPGAVPSESKKVCQDVARKYVMSKRLDPSVLEASPLSGSMPPGLWPRPLELSLQSSFQLSLTVLVSLSVTGSYLALRRVYDALWAALPSNPTLGKKPEQRKSSVLRAYHPLRAMAPVKVDLDWTSHCHEALPNTTFHAAEIVGGSVLGFYRFIRHY